MKASRCCRVLEDSVGIRAEDSSRGKAPDRESINNPRKALSGETDRVISML